MIQTFFERYYRVKDVYPVMRLLLPQLDKERAIYGMKESVLAKMYSDTFSLPKKDSESLKYWKNPTKQPLGAPSGDFTAVLISVLKNRCTSESQVTLKEVNSFLYDLSQKFDMKEKQDLFTDFIKKLTLLEQKWIVKLILKDLKIGLGHETLL